VTFSSRVASAFLMSRLMPIPLKKIPVRVFHNQKSAPEYYACTIEPRLFSFGHNLQFLFLTLLLF
jgi:hypothetical protein